MSVIRRGKSYWVDIGFNRSRIRKRSPENSFKGARAYELLLRQKLARGESIFLNKSTEKHLFRDMSSHWLEIYVKNNNKYSEYINKKYILNSDLIPYFGDRTIVEINGYMIERYKSHLISLNKLSPKSINNRLCVLSRCLRSAEEWGILANVPKIKLLKVPPQKYDYLTEYEATQLLTNAHNMWKDMILLAMKTGLRFGELIALQWKDINFEKKILTVSRNRVRDLDCSPKNNKSRIIPLTSSVMKMLSDKNKKYIYVFHDKRGEPLKHDYCIDNLHLICRNADIREIGWHSLRHTFASHLASRNNSIVAIKELMGHSDIKTTMRYTHVNLPVLANVISSLDRITDFNGTTTAQLENRDVESVSSLHTNTENH
ncbi:MAG: tyrosine-type recombinase/integrase [Ignavibacteria bacterium]